MTNNNKQSIDYKRVITRFLISIFVIILFLLLYFISTDSHDGEILNLNTSCNWWALLLTLAGIIFLPLCYLVATKKLNGIYKKLINSYRLFKSSIQVHEEIKDVVIILAIIVALILFFFGLSFNGSSWWAVFSTQLFVRLSNPNEPLNLRYILIGIAGIVTLFFTWHRLIITDQQKEDQIKRTEIESDRRLSERFDGAVTALSKKLDESSYPSHLGGISSLRTLAIDSSEYTQRCLDIICSCNEWMEGCIYNFLDKGDGEPYSSWLLKEDNRITKKNNQDKTGEITLLQEKRSQEALAAVSNILEYISAKRSKQIKALKFYNKMLCGISLRGMILDGIDFQNTYLVAASLVGTSLKQAKLSRANLQGASLNGAHLEGAILKDVHLERASLNNAYLAGVELSYTHLEGISLRGANLRKVSLEGVNLEGVCLNYANLEGVVFRATDLQGASFNGANLEGATLEDVHLEGAFLEDAHLEGASLNNVHLEGAIIVNTQFQGATINNINLSYSLLLNCNLYALSLRNINGSCIVFNDVVKTGYIKDKKERKRYLDNVCQHLRHGQAKLFPKGIVHGHEKLSPEQIIITGYAESFKQQMEIAWQVMENSQEPDGLDIIRKNSISPLNKKDKYDINKKNLTNLKKIWQERVDEEGIEFLRNMRHSISSIGRDSPSYYRKTKIQKEDNLTDKNSILVDKLQALIDQLIKSNQTKKSKKRIVLHLIT